MKKPLFALSACFFVFFLQANNYYVTTANDTGAGSLRNMIDSANLNPGPDTVTLSLTVRDTIHLGSALPFITDTLVITGLTCQNPTISGDSGAFPEPAFYAGGNSVPLTLNYLNIINCKSTHLSGGALYSAGPLYINFCYFYNNTAVNSGSGGNITAGAVAAQNLWVYNSTFNGNSCRVVTGLDTGSGGAISSGNMHLFNCTFTGNFATTFGGAVAGGISEIQNCTFAYNYADSTGGAIYSNLPAAGFVIANSIVWGNYVAGSTGGNLAGIQFTTANSSGGCNVLQDTSSADSFKIVSGDITGQNPLFGTFGYYAGCVPVLPVLCSSVAKNKASCTGATTTDAQGLPAQGMRDAGAYESYNPGLAAESPDTIAPGTMADLFDYINATGLTIQWPDGLTDSTAMMVDTGTYTVIGTNGTGCSDTATIQIVYGDSTTGIYALPSTGGIKIYPNPARDIATLEWSAPNGGEMELKISDILGRTVFSQPLNASAGKYALPLTAMSSGVYYLSLSNSASNTSGAKLVVLK